jgi:hypothetical protein
VTSAAGKAGTMVASEADKAGASTAPIAEDNSGDLCTTGSLPAPDP